MLKIIITFHEIVCVLMLAEGRWIVPLKQYKDSFQEVDAEIKPRNSFHVPSFLKTTYYSK